MLDKLIHFLKSADGYISGEEISRSFNISRAGIWKHIQELRSLGYEFEAVPHLGYKLVSSPDRLFPSEIKFQLKTKKIGEHIIYYDTISSTMDEAFRLAVDGAEEGTVICAEGQSKGRGRLGRTWSSPKGKGIDVSIILRPQVSPNAVSQITLLSAVAVCEAIKNASGLTAAIKWPNDLLINGKKCVGILTEMNAEIDRIKFVTVGIGVNVNTAANQLLPHATSLKNETRQNFSRVELLQEILRRIEYWYLQFQGKGFGEVVEKWKELSSTLGKHIRIVNAGQSIEGKAIDLDEDGGLVIRQDNTGTIIKKMTGDVVQIM